MFASSALPWSMKRTVHTQEVVRILSHCHSDLPWEEKAGYLTDFSARMLKSGYPGVYREQVIKSGLQAYRKIVERADSGVRPIHRTDNLDRVAREQARTWKRVSWYRRGGYTTTLFVPPTPGSGLKNLLQQAEARVCQGTGTRIRVVERAGRTLKSMLYTSDPSTKISCSLSDCMPCKGKTFGTCRTHNVVYKVTCQSCKDAAPPPQQPMGPGGATGNPAAPPGAAPQPGGPGDPVPTYVHRGDRPEYGDQEQRAPPEAQEEGPILSTLETCTCCPWGRHRNSLR